MSIKNIERFYNVAYRSICTTSGSLDYGRVTTALIKLCQELEITETDEFIWSIGEGNEATLADMLTGAFWHYSDWHIGQDSIEYVALSTIGGIFSPGMADGPEPDTGEQFIYELLNDMVGCADLPDGYTIHHDFTALDDENGWYWTLDGTEDGYGETFETESEAIAAAIEHYRGDS